MFNTISTLNPRNPRKDNAVTLYTQSGRVERRQHTRFVTAFEANLVDGDIERQVIVGDISAGGALIEGNQGLSTGKKIRLQANGLDVEACVMWMRDDVCGVRLGQLIDPLEVVENNSPRTRELQKRVESASLLVLETA